MAKVKMILTNGFDPDLRVYKEAKYIVSLGHEVEILCWDRDLRYKNKPTEIISGINIRRFFILSQYGAGLKKQMPSYMQFRKEVIAYLKTEEFDFLHCHDLDGALIGLGIKKKRVKKIFDMHEYYINYSNAFLNSIMAYLVQKTQNTFDFIIYLNTIQKNDVADRNRNKLVYLPNYSERSKFDRIEKTPSDTVRFGFAGWIRHYQQLANLIECVKNDCAFTLNLYGIGTQYEALYELKNERTYFYGKFNHEEINDIYRNIDILNVVSGNSPSEQAAYPTKFYEATFTKTPIIVEKNAVLADLVKQYDIGFIVDSSDINTYYQMMDEIKKDNTLLKRKSNNFNKLPETYAWEDIVKNLDHIYKG